MKKLCVLALSLLALPVLADNNRGFYVGAGAASFDDLQDAEDAKRVTAIEIFGGYKYNAALGIELRLGNGRTSDADIKYVDLQGASQMGTLRLGVDDYQSIYYKPELVNDEAKLYALLGYTHLKASAELRDAAGKFVKSHNESGSGFSYGVGVGFVINEHFNVNLEYRRICEEFDSKPNVASVNIDYRF